MAKKKAAKGTTQPKDKESVSENGAANEAASSEQAQPAQRQLIMHAQYVKDLSFENPKAVEALTNPGQQPAVEIGVQVNAEKVNDTQFEVRLNLTANAKIEDNQIFLVDLTYAGLVSVPGAEPQAINPLVMIEGPRLLFPFARSIISNVTRDGGFLPLNLQPIDFVAVYRHSLEAQRQAAEGKTTQ